MALARAVTNKHDMLDLMHRGAFGNCMRTWYTIDDLLASGYPGPVGIRNLVRSATFMMPHLTLTDAVRIAVEKQRAGKRFYFQESPPDEYRTIQGELSEVEGTLTFYYSTAALPMRPALIAAGQHAIGLRAKLILRNSLTPDSYDDIMALLDTYEKHVIEFTAFDRCVGWARGRNACVWEVRAY